MAADWREYQNEVADFFRSIGMCSDVDVTLKGVRTDHDIDVVVRSKHLGFEILWIVECKHWKSPVSKLHVLALREIVADLGADRGIILCEAGFQSGAIEAANLTNVRVSSLDQISSETKGDVAAMRLRDIADRVSIAKTLYWDLDKGYRIKVGLRAEWYEHEYSGDSIVRYSEMVLSEARLGRYPIKMGGFVRVSGFDLPSVYESFEEVSTVLNPILTDLEKRLEQAHADLVKYM